MRAFEMPETVAEQVAWLEAEMVGTKFPQVVAELLAVAGDQRAQALRLTPEQTSRVLSAGLGALEPAEFKQLMQCPAGFLELQRLLLVEGGDYWSEIAPPADLNDAGRLSVNLSMINTNSRAAPSTAVPPTRSKWKSNAAWAGLASLATAAAMFVMLNNGLLGESETPTGDLAQQVPRETQRLAPVKNAWGFEQFAQQTQNQTGAGSSDRVEYLVKLADAAESWSNQRPNTQVALADRIGEFRMGCSQIMLTTHSTLPESDQTWLKTRCQSWAAALDRHLAAVESGTPIEEVIASVDSTVTKISAALRGRAETDV